MFTKELHELHGLYEQEGSDKQLKALTQAF